MINRSVLLGAILAVFSGAAHAYDTCPIGFAAVNSMGQDGTTGGSTGTVVTVTTKTDLATYAAKSGAYTILVSGSLNGSGSVSVTSDKSIIGLGTGASLEGFGLDINGQRNIIIRNLAITSGNPDAIAMRNTHHVWVDHCELSTSYDALLDITVGSGYVTVSNTILRDHDKCSLVNGGTNHFEDVGKCQVTYHHNWFKSTIQRNPRAAYGPVHLFNNYYTSVSSYCVGYHTGAKVLVENNYFQSSANPLLQMYSSDPTNANYGDAESIGNIFNVCTGNTTGTGVSFDPEAIYDYAFALYGAADVPATIQATAGPKSGCDFVLIPTPGNGTIDRAAATPSLTWTNLPDAVSWNVYFGTTTSPAYQTNQTGRSWNPGLLAPDTTYYWRVDTVKSVGTINGQLWQFRTAPVTASKPYPANGQINTPRRIPNTATTMKPMELSWTAGFGGVSHDLYLGTSPVFTAGDYKGRLSSASYAPGLLNSGTTYYWRVDTVRADSSVVTGAVWSFTTDPVVNAPNGRTEAEQMARNGRYFLWPSVMCSNGYGVTNESGPGSVCAYYSGTSAICDVTITYMDMINGSARFYLLVNNASVGQWDAAANTNALAAYTIRTQLNTGDEICIIAYTNDEDFARIDRMDIAVAPGASDFTPPSPNPMTWAVQPYGTDYDSITMTATTATDSYGVQYYFTCTSGNGHDSGWQDSPTYIDYSLPAKITPTAIYTYTVKARDKSANYNQTTASSAASATTLPLTTSLIRVNFQPSSTRTPAGYLAESGSLYGAKSCGLSYGWNISHSDCPSERMINTDKRLDTLMQFHIGGYWEIGLPNGLYDVTVAIGDASSSTINTINVEGAPYWNNQSLSANVFATKTMTVSVSDGRLTIDQGSGGEKQTRICYVIISLKTTPDSDAPIPNPMTWTQTPRPLSNSTITMTATTAYDASGVEYYFACTAGGGHDSGWQSSPTYTDTGLTPSTTYTYRVKARDTSAARNETSYSGTASATTPLTSDMAAPTPNPMKWAVLPHATGATTIMMTAVTATDTSGVEYYFACVAGSGHDSGWQDSTLYIDTGLTSGNTYSYTVTARDKSGNQNVGSPSAAASATAGSVAAPLVRINYQTAAAPIPSGYLPDTGIVYGDRGNGFTYGWDRDCTSMTRYYDNGVTDPRLRTYINFYKTSYWQIAVANGLYDVEATIGDPCYARNGYYLNVEGVNYWSNVNLLAKEFKTETRTVSVSDGKLTVDAFGIINDKDTRLCYVIITPITAADTASPTPSTMSWSAAPSAASSTSITMTAAAASDASGVEYYFACTSGGGHDSGWQDSRTYVNTGLANSTTYSYKVKARDKSINRNETGYSGEASTTTPRYSCTPAATDLNADCQVDFADFAAAAGGWAGTAGDFAALRLFAAEWLSCNREPSAECWQ